MGWATLRMYAHAALDRGQHEALPERKEMPEFEPVEVEQPSAVENVSSTWQANLELTMRPCPSWCSSCDPKKRKIRKMWFYSSSKADGSWKGTSVWRTWLVLAEAIVPMPGKEGLAQGWFVQCRKAWLLGPSRCRHQAVRET